MPVISASSTSVGPRLRRAKHTKDMHGTSKMQEIRSRCDLVPAARLLTDARTLLDGAVVESVMVAWAASVPSREIIDGEASQVAPDGAPEQVNESC